MKSEDLYRAIGEIGEDLLERSEKAQAAEEEKPPSGPDAGKFRVVNNKKRRTVSRTVWFRGAAAAVVLLLLGSAAVGIARHLRMGSAAPAEMAEAVTEEAAQDAAPAEMKSAEDPEPSEESYAAMEEEADEAFDTEEAYEAAEAEVPAEAQGGGALIDTGVIEEKAVPLILAGSGAAANTADTAAMRGEGAPRTLRAFEEACSGELLASDTDENTVYSPLNLYLSLAMLTEITEGESRQDVLDLLRAESNDELHLAASLLLERAAYDNAAGKSIPAAALWLANGTSYHLNALQSLAERYRASSFAGEMGSPEYDEMLRSWIGEQTGGLLTDAAKDLHMDPNTAIALTGTLYYKAAWDSGFMEIDTADGIFHTASGDVTVPMMKQLGELPYYEGDGYRAAAIPLTDGNRMWFILPDEGSDPETVLSAADWLRVTNTEEIYDTVHITVPKFTVSEQKDLLSWLKEKGFDAITSYSEDFAPILSERARLDEVKHAAYVSIDEEGVTGAAYTYEAAAAEGAFEIGSIKELTLDRPFLFAVTDENGILWFAGAVRNPE